jgi:hypothetical protein
VRRWTLCEVIRSNRLGERDKPTPVQNSNEEVD